MERRLAAILAADVVGFPSPYQPDSGQSAIYRTDSGPDSWRYACRATIVGNLGKPSGNSRFKSLIFLMSMPNR